MNSHAKFRGAARRGFSGIYEKPPGGRIFAPPVGARVKNHFILEYNLIVQEDSWAFREVAKCVFC